MKRNVIQLLILNLLLLLTIIWLSCHRRFITSFEYPLSKNTNNGTGLEGFLDSINPSFQAPLVTVICNNQFLLNFQKTDVEIEYDYQRQITQFRVMLGTLLYFSKSKKWRIIVMTYRQHTFDELILTLKNWPPWQKNRLELEWMPISIPNVTQENYKLRNFINGYRPCVWQKIFFDHALPKENSVVYIDSDILFTGPAEKLWKKFIKLIKPTFIALGPEPWYLEENDRPFAGRTGINTGVMLLNLSQMRMSFPVTKSWGLTMLEGASQMSQSPRHDQDLVNFYFNKTPSYFHELSYKWNFLPSDCLQRITPPCIECQADGISIVHGADASFYKNLDPIYTALYTVMEKLTRSLKMSPKALFNEIAITVKKIKNSNRSSICKHFSSSFIAMTTHHLRLLAGNRKVKLFDFP